MQSPYVNFNYDVKYHIVQYLVKEINQNNYKNVLSVCCGNGYLDNVIKAGCYNGTKITGIDKDKERISYAKTNFKDIDCMLFDLEFDNMDFSKFDFAYSVNGTTFLDDRTYYRLLRNLKGCKAIVDYSAYTTGLSLLKKKINNVIDVNYKEKYHRRSIDERDNIFNHCNLEVVDRHIFKRHLLSKLKEKK